MSFFSKLLGGGKKRQERRRQMRVNGAGIRVRIDTHVFPVADLSLSGFRVDEYKGSLIENQTVHFEIQIMVANQVNRFPAHGRVIRATTEDLAVRFINLQPYYRKFLEEFINMSELPH